MRFLLVTPTTTLRRGNVVTAKRWQGLLRQLGHRAEIARSFGDGEEACDALVALHARKSFESIERFRLQRPSAPLVVALTGTDLYGDLGRSVEAEKALGWADRLIVLQRRGLDLLPPHLQDRARVILQSATATASP
ncbi:MAG: TIGR04348 family glycosyltransferase, partial [Acidobacteriota bacterium]